MTDALYDAIVGLAEIKRLHVDVLAYGVQVDGHPRPFTSDANELTPEALRTLVRACAESVLTSGTKAVGDEAVEPPLQAAMLTAAAKGNIIVKSFLSIFFPIPACGRVELHSDPPACTSVFEYVRP